MYVCMISTWFYIFLTISNNELLIQVFWYRDCIYYYISIIIVIIILALFIYLFHPLFHVIVVVSILSLYYRS